MNSYSSMTLDQLRQEIATRLDYKIIKNVDGALDNCYQLPDGSIHPLSQCADYNEERIFWSDTVPDWTHKIEEALTLLTGEYFHACTISGFGDFGWSVILEDHVGHKYEGHHKDLARAVCEAWLDATK